MTAGRWRDAKPELIIAAVIVIAVAAAGAAVAGLPGVVAVAVAASVVATLLLRGVIPRSAAQGFRKAKEKQRARAISGYRQRAFVIASSFNSRAMYESDLRPVLEHILAARLAENHSVNLYTEPERARQVFCAAKGDELLWRWVDPGQALSNVDRIRSTAGVSRRTLGRLIGRLEQL